MGEALRADLIESLLNGENSYERQQIDYDDFTADKLKTYPRLIQGQLSFADPKRRVKLLDKTVSPFYDAELARQYLNHVLREQGTRKHVGHSKKSAAMLKVAPPRFFAGPVDEGTFAYLDMEAAYFQLYETATLDLHFDPGAMSLGRGRLEFLSSEWLKDEKVIRRCVTGIATSRHIPITRYGKTHLEKTYNKFLAPGLWGYLMFNLHYMAREIVERFGAVYWNTDGFIIDASRMEAAQSYLESEWGARFNVKGLGPGYVHGSASYKCGDLVTLAQNKTGRINNLMPYNSDLAKKLKWWRGWLRDRKPEDTY